MRTANILFLLLLMALMLSSCRTGVESEAAYNGIDVSHYQGDINWKKVGEMQNIKFVYIKASEGKNWVDNRHVEYAKKAKAQGLKVGFYHFFRSNVPGTDQFDNYLKAIQDCDPDLIPVLDIEVEPKTSQKAAFEQNIRQFMKLCKKRLGVYPIIYTMPNFDHKYLKPFKKYKKWYCGRINENARMKKCLIWQIAIKPVPGIMGRVDWNFCPKLRKIKN